MVLIMYTKLISKEKEVKKRDGVGEKDDFLQKERRWMRMGRWRWERAI